jgi:formylglycine-generating enzyme required for sulfatase activity
MGRKIMLRKSLISMAFVLLLFVLWGAVAQAGLEGNGDFWGYLPIIRHKFPHLPTPTPTPEPTPLPTPQPPPGMAYIPEGEFSMGCDPSFPECGNLVWPSNPHAVFLDAYFIDIHEVTNARYQACVSAGACNPPANTFSVTRPTYYNDPAYANYPVIYVDWDQAKTFCEWEGKRLPTEAEWEKAARGDQDNRLYSWGNTLSCSMANYTFDNIFFSVPCIGDTTEVGSYPMGASPFGMMDMVGNNWEWVNDWFDINYYGYSPHENPQGPATGTMRIIRGGSWFGNQLDAVSSFRGRIVPDRIEDDVGVRCVESP